MRAVAPASCCSTSLLDLNFHAVHLCGNLFRLVTDFLEKVDPRVCSNLGLGVLHCLGFLRDLVLLGKHHVLWVLVFSADSSNLVLELVGVLDLEVLSVGGKDELVTRLNLGLLGGLPRQLVLGVQGAGEGSGARLLLLQVKLLVLSTVRVHLHDNPLGLGADVLGAGDDCARAVSYTHLTLPTSDLV